MKFDWRHFCIENNINYVTSGPNTARGNISVRCPWCGSQDESQHMGLSLDINKPDFGCWRHQSHRGRNPALLIAKLMGWSLQQAVRYVESQGDNPDDFAAAMAGLSSSKKEESHSLQKELKMPPEFREFNGTFTKTEERFFMYLQNTRGFGPWTQRLIRSFSLRYCIQGAYAQRIIIPVYQKCNLVTWTARAVTAQAHRRYKALEAAYSIVNIKDSILSSRVLLRKRLLVVTEGPFDMMKLAMVGDVYGLQTCCVFGLTISNRQLQQLSSLARGCGNVVVLLDSTASLEADKMASQIEEVAGVPVRVFKLIEGLKDAGEATPRQVVKLCKILAGEVLT